ncbi:MAG: tetratricopeptide repeat protein [Candidatus Brocadiaceae bacterium]|nr:tetratricopeptide repeat protein [Candidatus Brocadiaceae bacterium]
MHIFDKSKRLSDSLLWEYQRSFFEQRGVKAWEAGVVPFYITSNPFIANCYAEVTIGFILDHVARGKYYKDYPFYVVEIGTGSGKFSYHCMSRIFGLQKEYDLTDVDICYVMTDFTASNIAFWTEHPKFSEYLKNGQLDFAIFDLTAENDVILQNRKTILGPETVKNPIIAYGNYLFDSTQHDIYQVKDKKIKEGRVTLRTKDTPNPDMSAGNRPERVEDIDVSVDYHEMSDDVLSNPLLEKILNEYATNLRQASVLIPTSAFRCFDALRKISEGRLLFIGSDNGYCYLNEIEGRTTPGLTMHNGCFSMAVNFHAIGRYFEFYQGDCWHQRLREGVKTSVFLMGEKFTELVYTRKAVKTYIDEFGPVNFFHFHEHLKKTIDSCSLSTILSHLHFCRWDPRIFNYFISEICNNLNSAHSILQDTLNEGIEKIIDNIYDMPGVEESYFNVGLLLQGLGRFQEALECYQKALEFGERSYPILYNIALCHNFLNNISEAKKYLEQANELKP